MPITEPLGSMVVDIGGGTTEVAVLSVSDIVASRSLRVGGDHMDQALVDHLRRRYGLRIGLAAAERLRIDCGSAAPLEEERAEEVAGVDVASGLPRRVTVTSPELRERWPSRWIESSMPSARPSIAAAPIWRPIWSLMAWC